MATLLMRLVAPMQAWGNQSHFSYRDSGREPTKSAVLGLLSAAMGRNRNESNEDLNALRMAVRVDCEGLIRRDFQTAGMGGVYRVSGGVKDSLIPSDRFYLADAKFLVGLEGDIFFLQSLQAALQSPRWFLFLGRKAFIPSDRVWLKDGLQTHDLETAIRTYPWLGRGTPPTYLRLVIEDQEGSIVRNDLARSFQSRYFLPRRMRQEFIEPFGSEEAKE